ncbi:thioredoxin-disulfide reductase [Parapedobacter sp. 2B3]|uniref:thioredoxin-disulfide reductase n=1 Tax=Parapedobacter sp. 2B3 TaxID=3342381 RepID=UPI0035B69206
MSQETEHVKCLIIGSGPAGYTAAIYAARADLKPVVYTGIVPGGQLTQTTDVENFPGYTDGVLGPQMMEDFRKQAERFGTDVRFGYITEVDFSGSGHRIVVDGEKTIIAETVIIATGATAKWLGLESEQKYNGFGVSACAVCDGFFFKGQDVAIVGAGDTAAEEATYLAKLASKVHMLVRRDEFRASKAMQHRVLNTPNIEIHYHTETKEIVGDGQSVTGIRVYNNQTLEEEVIPVTGFFVAIGHKPNTELFVGKLDMDTNGYLITQPDSTRTNIEGVFACGDVQDHVYRQAVTAAGTGCMAALEAERYLAAKEFSVA